MLLQPIFVELASFSILVPCIECFPETFINSGFIVGPVSDLGDNFLRILR